MERSASLQNVATTSYAAIAGSPQEQRDPRLRTRTQQKTPDNLRSPFDKAHRSPVKTPEAPKPFCRPPKRQQDPDDEPSTAGRSIRQKIDDVEQLPNRADLRGNAGLLLPLRNPMPHKSRKNRKNRLNRRNRLTLRSRDRVELRSLSKNLSHRSSFVIPDDAYCDNDSDDGASTTLRRLDAKKLVLGISKLKKIFREELSRVENSLKFLSDQITTIYEEPGDSHKKSRIRTKN
ncbi:hypothetical protein ACJJTC_010242 [Scirpophaga incertulas]